MKIKELVADAALRVEQIPDGRLAAEVLLAFVLNCGRDQLFLDADKEVSQVDKKKFLELFGRFYAGEPVAYITGVKEFYGLEFVVDRNVLIPRPETEHLIDEVADFAKKAGRPLKILDVGTGSGCIAVSLAKKFPGAEVVATDVSAEALEVAGKNALRHGVSGQIKFVQSDLLQNVEGEFDVIVANLPYIGREKFNFVSREALEYEPHVALFGGSDGLQLYEKLFEQVCGMSKKPQLLIGEFGFLQGENMRELLQKFFGDVSADIRKDYASIERMFVVAFPELT